jgi:hypothetical protein
MKPILFFVLCLTGCLFAQAQQTESLGERVYFYDHFQRGTVYFLDGSVSHAMLNYNFVQRDMQILDHQSTGNRILDLVRSPDLSHIQIGDDIFVPLDKGYAVVILDGPVALMRKKDIIASREITGIFGIPTETAATNRDVRFGSATGEFTDVSSLHIPPPSSNFRYRVEITYFLMKDRKIYPVTRRNFLRLYREVRPQLEAFLSEHSVDFRNEEHLRGLTLYANSLMMAL